MNELNLDQLSDAQIKKLWQAKQAKDRQQLQEAERAALADMGIADEGYYRDQFGNIVEGTKPASKSGGYFINSSGYVQELLPGEQPPESGSGDHIRDWLRTVDIANDSEIRAALGEANLYFEEQMKIGDSNTWLIGKLETAGWLVNSRSDDQRIKDLKFRVPKTLSREEAISQAESYVKMKFGPVYPALTTEQIRVCERLACSDRNAAFTYYLRARLPEDIADQMLALASEGNSLGHSRVGRDRRHQRHRRGRSHELFLLGQPPRRGSVL
jgi:hypothetical protein